MILARKGTIRYDTRCYFNVRSKADMALNVYSKDVRVKVVLKEHTHPFNGPLSGTTRVSRYQKVKTNLDLLMHETVSGSGISWDMCKSAACSRQITTLAPHRSVFLQAGCPSCRPTDRIKCTEGKVLKEH